MSEQKDDIVDRLLASRTQARAIDRSELLYEAAHDIKVLRKVNQVLSALLSAKQARQAQNDGVENQRGEDLRNPPAEGNSGDTRSDAPIFYR